MKSKKSVFLFLFSFAFLLFFISSISSFNFLGDNFNFKSSSTIDNVIGSCPAGYIVSGINNDFTKMCTLDQTGSGADTFFGNYSNYVNLTRLFGYDYYNASTFNLKLGNTTNEIFGVCDNSSFLKVESDPLWTANQSLYSTHLNVNENFSSIKQDTFAGNYSNYVNTTIGASHLNVIGNQSYPINDTFNGNYSNYINLTRLFDYNYFNSSTWNNLWNSTSSDTFSGNYSIMLNTTIGATHLNVIGNQSVNYIHTLNLTTAKYDGNISNNTHAGYVIANKICSTNFTGSHFCNEFEIQEWFAHQSNIIMNNNDTWIIAGSPKYIPASVPVNDCNGWTYEETVSYLGNYWHIDNSTGGDGRALNCATTLPLACCT